MNQRQIEDMLIGMPNPNKEAARVIKQNGATQFPGTQLGATIEQVRNWIKRQKRAKGYPITIGVGTTTVPIDISGTARIFLGLAFIQEDPDFLDQATISQFLINNEVIIQDTFMSFFGSTFTDEEYYSFPRPLDGTDSVSLIITSPTAQQARLIIYYL